MLTEYSDKQLAAEMKRRAEKNAVDISEADLKKIDGLSQETAVLTKGELIAVAITPEVVVHALLYWEDDDEASIAYEEINRGFKTGKNKSLQLLTDGMEYYLEQNIWELLEIPEAFKLYKAFNKRVKNVCRAADKLAEKYQLNSQHFFGEFIGDQK